MSPGRRVRRRTYLFAVAAVTFVAVVFFTVGDLAAGAGCLVASLAMTSTTAHYTHPTGRGR